MRLRAANCRTNAKQCVCRAMVALLGRPCAQRLSPGTRALRGRLAQSGHFCPLPSRLGRSTFLRRIFAPRGNVTTLYDCLARLLHRITILCHRRGSIRSVFGRLCHRSLFGDCALIGHLLDLVRANRLDNIHASALGQLLGHLLASTGVPFRKRPTVNVRMVKILRAHGLSFHGLVVLSLGRKRLPGTKNSSSFVPCGLEGTFNVAAVRRGGTICTCCFCHLVRQTRGIALLCGASSSKLGHKRVSHFVLRFLMRSPRGVSLRCLRTKRSPRRTQRVRVRGAPRVLRRVFSTCGVRRHPGTFFSPSTLGTCLSYHLGFCCQCMTNLGTPSRMDTRVSSTLFNAVFRHSTRLICGRLATGKQRVHGSSLRRLLGSSIHLRTCISGTFGRGFFRIPLARRPRCGNARLVRSGIVTSCLHRLLHGSLRCTPFHVRNVRRSIERVVRVSAPRKGLTLRVNNAVSHLSDGKSALHVISCGANNAPGAPRGVRRLFAPTSGHPGCVFRAFLCTTVLYHGRSLGMTPSLLCVRQTTSRDCSPIVRVKTPQRPGMPIGGFTFFRSRFHRQLRKLLRRVFDRRRAFDRARSAQGYRCYSFHDLYGEWGASRPFVEGE